MRAQNPVGNRRVRVKVLSLLSRVQACLRATNDTAPSPQMAMPLGLHARGGNAGLRAPLAPGSRVYFEIPGFEDCWDQEWWGAWVIEDRGSDLSIVFDDGELEDMEACHLRCDPPACLSQVTEPTKEALCILSAAGITVAPVAQAAGALPRRDAEAAASRVALQPVATPSDDDNTPSDDEDDDTSSSDDDEDGDEDFDIKKMEEDSENEAEVVESMAKEELADLFPYARSSIAAQSYDDANFVVADDESVDAPAPKKARTAHLVDAAPPPAMAPRDDRAKIEQLQRALAHADARADGLEAERDLERARTESVHVDLLRAEDQLDKKQRELRAVEEDSHRRSM